MNISTGPYQFRIPENIQQGIAIQQQQQQLQGNDSMSKQEANIISMYPNCNLQTSTLQNTVLHHPQQQVIQQQHQNQMTMYPYNNYSTTHDEAYEVVNTAQESSQSKCIQLEQQQQDQNDSLVQKANVEQQISKKTTRINVKDQSRGRITQTINQPRDLYTESGVTEEHNQVQPEYPTYQLEEEEPPKIIRQDNCIVYRYPNSESNNSQANGSTLLQSDDNQSRQIAVETRQHLIEENLKMTLREPATVLNNANRQGENRNRGFPQAQIQDDPISDNRNVEESETEEQHVQSLNRKSTDDSPVEALDLKIRWANEKRSTQETSYGKDRIEANTDVMTNTLEEDMAKNKSIDEPFNLTIRRNNRPEGQEDDQYMKERAKPAHVKPRTSTTNYGDDGQEATTRCETSSNSTVLNLSMPKSTWNENESEKSSLTVRNNRREIEMKGSDEAWNLSKKNPASYCTPIIDLTKEINKPTTRSTNTITPKQQAAGKKEDTAHNSTLRDKESHTNDDLEILTEQITNENVTSIESDAVGVEDKELWETLAEAEKVLNPESTEEQTDEYFILDDQSGDFRRHGMSIKRNSPISQNLESEDYTISVKRMKSTEEQRKKENEMLTRPPPSYKEAISTLIRSNPHYAPEFQQAVANGIISEQDLTIARNQQGNVLSFTPPFETEQQIPATGVQSATQGQVQHDLEIRSQTCYRHYDGKYRWQEK